VRVQPCPAGDSFWSATTRPAARRVGRSRLLVGRGASTQGQIANRMMHGAVKVIANPRVEGEGQVRRKIACAGLAADLPARSSPSVAWSSWAPNSGRRDISTADYFLSMFHLPGEPLRRPQATPQTEAAATTLTTANHMIISMDRRCCPIGGSIPGGPVTRRSTARRGQAGDWLAGLVAKVKPPVAMIIVLSKTSVMKLDLPAVAA
jgi:hypothetical protein